ncbi:uncharacterized protein KY384_002824 [Bacidia gigantensis]|uniref:uncharacterized protein n=1 Tax=Bacidia gigantensis TaxID=2732470 RepID=UPI001D045A03|nr:uncharacterized protein KY384_002824 [Bacidia gigantensis]KAG8532946.1 hypothetical protein KY384_002824 [Bacidia gigantensis]
MASTRLTALDLLMPPAYTRLLLTFGRKGEDEVSSIDTILREGLSRLVETVPVLKGEVFTTGQRAGEVAVQPRTDIKNPPLFQVRDYTLKDGKPMKSYLELYARDMPMTELDGEDLAPLPTFLSNPAPVFAAQANFIAGGLILCACFHHSVFDGPGAGVILKVWSECCNFLQNPADGPKLLSPVATDRNVLLESGKPSTSLDILAGYEITTPSKDSTTEEQSAPTVAVTEMTTATFTIQNETLQRLKVDVNTYLSQRGKNEWVSTNDILCAGLWRAITKARLESPDAHFGTTSRVGMAVNGRSRMQPPLSDEYVGNVNIYTATEIDMPPLFSDATESLAEIAVAIRRSVLSVNDEYIRHLIHKVNQLPDLSLITPSFKVWGNDLAITTWREMGICDLDWGSGICGGKVDFVRIPSARFHGLCVVLPRTSHKPDAVEVLMGLKTESMERLKGDASFKNFASFQSERGSLKAGEGSTFHPALSILLPLWAWPDASWQNVYTAISSSPSTTWHIVINPNSGPGTTGSAPSAQVYTDGVAKLNTYANALTYGYVKTGKAGRAQADVHAEVDTYASWATHVPENISIAGIFFDEVSSMWDAQADASKIQYYTDVANYARQKPGLAGHVAFNPGTLGPEQLFDVADFMVEFENAVGEWHGADTIATFPQARLGKSAVWVYNSAPETDVAGAVAVMQGKGLGAPTGCYKTFDAGNLKTLTDAVGGGQGQGQGGAAASPGTAGTAGNVTQCAAVME